MVVDNPTLRINSKWILPILFIFLAAGNIIIGFPDDTEQDTWISILLSMAIIFPVFAIYARMMKIMPEKNIFAMSEYALGKQIGKFVSILFIIYALLCFILMIFAHTCFVNLSALRHTPFFILLILYFIAILHLSNSGLSTISKWCMVILVTWIIFIVFFDIISVPNQDYNNLLPMFAHKPGDIFYSAVKIAILPFGEIVLTLGIANNFDKKVKKNKLYILALISVGAYLLLVFIRNCTLIGAKTMSSVVFTTYRSLNVVKISDFFERVEILLGAIYVFAGIAKGAVIISAFTNGIKSVFGFKDYKKLLIPCAFFALTFAFTPFKGFSQLMEFVNDVYYKIAPFFQLLIPIIIWIPAEIKYHRHKNDLVNVIKDANEEIDEISGKTKAVNVKKD